MYGLPDRSNKGLYIVKVQYDTKIKSIKTVKQYWEAILKDLSKFRDKNKGKRDMIIAGDLNESINFNQIVEFLTENGLLDAYR